MEEKLTIRVTGLGHKLTLKDLPAESTTVEDLFQKVFDETGLPPRFQKFIGPQKLNIVYSDEQDDRVTRSLADMGIKDRTRLMLLHSPVYQAEKDTHHQLVTVQTEISDLDKSIREQASRTQKPGYVAEMVTRICCKLDGIDTSGSKDLRAHRKALIQKAESLEGLASSAAEANKAT